MALHSGSLALTTPPGDAVLRDLLMRASDTVTISYDPNCRPMLMGNPMAVLRGVHEMLGVADVVKVSSEDLKWLLPDMTPEQVVDDWLSRGPTLVAVTLGPDGVVAGTSSGLRARRPGVAVKVIDTVGAGDTFSAALLAGLHGHGLLGGDRPGQAADAGLQHAGRAAARRGARGGDRLLAAGRRPAHARRPAAVPAGLAHLRPAHTGRGRRMTAPDPFRHPPPTSQGPAGSGRGLRSG